MNNNELSDESLSENSNSTNVTVFMLDKSPSSTATEEIEKYEEQETAEPDNIFPAMLQSSLRLVPDKLKDLFKALLRLSFFQNFGRKSKWISYQKSIVHPPLML
uniref:Uncharacterized protein n=1 Tax=Megaselia scalaris TaxID=36166 RepID=T1GBL8_MEGSC